MGMSVNRLGLCVGGPLDGQTRYSESDYLETHEPMEIGLVENDGFKPTDTFSVIRYKKEWRFRMAKPFTGDNNPRWYEWHLIK